MALYAALLGATQGLPACRVAPPGGVHRAAPRPCVELANAFASIAAYRNRGVSREEQVEIARDSAGGDESDATFRQWLYMIDLVYRYSDASAEEIGWTVLDHCSLDDAGRATVTTLWPRR